MIDKKNNKIRSFLTFFMLILTFFLLGVFFSASIKQYFVKSFVKKTNIVSNNLDLKEFYNVYDLLKNNYYNIDSVDNKKLVNGAIKGMIKSLGDKHSEFMDNEETKKFNAVLSGDFEGIGAVVEKVGLGVKVDRLIKGSPAKKAGIKKDDIIIKANQVKLGGMDLFDAVNKIKGPSGTDVDLEILRDGEKDVLNIKVKREKIKIPSVETKTFTGTYNDIGYIALNMFGENSSEEFEKALNKFKNKDGIIIDLRDNGGGYLQSAVQILSNFIENGKTLVETKYRNSLQNNKYLSLNYDKPYNGKIVVLLNGNSASASEITALSLKENKKAILVGDKSYGKGSVQEPFNLEDGSLLKLTIAKWFVPNHKNIDGIGITPDIKVDFTKQDFKKLFDRQLDIAKKVLKDFINLDSINKVKQKWNKLYKQRGITNSGTILTGSLNK